MIAPVARPVARPWTDDLPKCRNTCVASYFSRLGGGNVESNDDYLCFHCQTEDNSSLYGVFEPHNGLEAAQFIMQRMAAELLLPPPSASNTDEEIRDRLRNAFNLVEKAYIENYDSMIAERTSLQYQLQTLTESQAVDAVVCRLKEIDRHLSGGATVMVALVHNNKLFCANESAVDAVVCRLKEIDRHLSGGATVMVALVHNNKLFCANETAVDAVVCRLKEIDRHLSGGATVMVALVHNNKLFCANVGCCRALLCRTDANSVLRVVQLTADHSLHNEDELLRLRQAGLDPNKLRTGMYVGNQPGTRCLGNYLVKGLYRAFPALSGARADPVLPTPELHGPVMLDDSCRFLVLVSSGVYKRIAEVKGSSDQANKQLAQIIVENFRKQTEFKKVSRSVLDEIEEEFVSYCIKNNLTPKSNTHMTLLIRNFNFISIDPEPNLVPKQQNPSVRFNPIVQSKSNTLLNELDSEIYSSGEATESNLDTNRSTESTSDMDPGVRHYDRDRKIKPYVDFSCYYDNVAKARKNGTLPNFIE